MPAREVNYGISRQLGREASAIAITTQSRAVNQRSGLRFVPHA